MISISKAFGLCVFLFFELTSLFIWGLFLIPTLLRKIFTSLRTKSLKRVLHTTQNYEEWLKTAYQLDKEASALSWRFDNSSHLYDYQYIEKIISFLEEFMETKNVPQLIHLTRSILMRNFSGINNQSLYNYCFSGTKALIDRFHDVVDKALDFIYQSDHPKKLEFFLESKHFYGRSGLMLSGGASFGMFHCGVLSALNEFDLLPNVVCGSSAGSLVAAFFATKDKQELLELDKSNYASLDFSAFEGLNPRFSFFRKIKRLFTHGYMIDSERLINFVKTNTYNLTFREAFEKTKIALNITVTDSQHKKFRILNYISAPDVYVWSGAMASCSLPYVYAPTNIKVKKPDGTEGDWLPEERYFIDGSFGADMPISSISTLFNVTNIIAVQVNIHLLPFIHRSYYHINSIKYGVYRLIEMFFGFIISEVIHRARQLTALGIVPSFVQTVFNLLLQEYWGNVNISPSFDFGDFFNILANPNRELIIKWARRGRNRAFFHIKQIEHFAKIERKLNYCISQLKLKKATMNRESSYREFFDRESSSFTLQK